MKYKKIISEIYTQENKYFLFCSSKNLVYKIVLYLSSRSVNSLNHCSIIETFRSEELAEIHFWFCSHFKWYISNKTNYQIVMTHEFRGTLVKRMKYYLMHIFFWKYTLGCTRNTKLLNLHNFFCISWYMLQELHKSGFYILCLLSMLLSTEK